MRIAIVGGTGDIGEGLALRWGRDTDHELRIGSRSEEKAATAGRTYEEILGENGVERSFEAGTNATIVSSADIVVLAIPPTYVRDTLMEITPSLPDDAIVVSPAVGIKREADGFRYDPPSVGSVTELVANVAEENQAVVGAFHTLPARRLADLDAPLGIDTAVVGDDVDAKTTIIELANSIDGLRALDGGRLSNAGEFEALTPSLINLAMENDDLHELGIRFE